MPQQVAHLEDRSCLILPEDSTRLQRVRASDSLSRECDDGAWSLNRQASEVALIRILSTLDHSRRDSCYLR